MKQVYLLEAHDIVLADDWIRPLIFVSSDLGNPIGADSLSPYGGSPVNNVHWVRVRDCIGKCHWGSSLGELNAALHLRYEVMRGEPPEGHVFPRKQKGKTRR